MAQMAPALTEANASPGSSRKNSVDRSYSSTVPEELKQGSLSSGVDLKLLSRNGLVRLLEDTDSSNNITNTNGAVREEPSRFYSTPKSSKRNEETFVEADMPNGHSDGEFSKVVENMAKSSSIANDSQNRKPAIPCDLSQRACASSTTTVRPAGACNIESENADNSRITQHPVATFDSRKAGISKRTVRAIEQQARLESRAKKLEKRLRRLQTRQIGGHVHHQLNGIVNQHREKAELTNCSTKQGGNTTCGGIFEGKKADCGDVFAKEPLSSSTLQSLESDKDGVIAKGSRNASSNNNSSQNKYENAIKYSPESVNKTIRIALIEEKQKYEAESLAESLRTHVEHLEAMYDSDATEASSGDESEDEEYLSISLQSKTSKLLRKQYLSEKGEIGSQWSWLQSQIINLERQIRRYEDLHRSIRLSKQPVKLQEVVVPSSEVKHSTSPYAGGIPSVGIPCGQPVKVNNVSPLSEPSDARLKGILKEPENHLRNGMKKSLLQDSAVDESEIPLKKLRTKLLMNDTNDNKYSSFRVPNGDISQCARTRGIYPITQRPLVHLPWAQLKCKSKKSYCQCSLPETPCFSCSKLTKTIPVVDSSLPKAERVGLLDQSFHPVLSFPTEIPLQFHFASLLKKGGFESRTQPTKPQPIKSSSHIDKKKNNQTKSQRRAQLAKGAAATLLSSAKLRNQRYERKRGYASLPSTPKNAKNHDRECHTDNIPRKKRAAAISAAAQLQKRARSLSLPCTGSSPSTPTSSPSPTPPLSNSLPHSSLSLMLRKKRASNAFDINNIVIPYSMASSTRVEKLQYKEIPTPSWRILEIQDEIKEEEGQNLEENCLDEDIIEMRHDICEEHERKRFLGFLTKKRKRSSRQSSETSNLEGVPDSQAASTPPGTPLLHSPSPTSANVPGTTASAITPSFHRSFSVDSRLSHRRSSSTESLQRTSDVETWPTVNPWPDRTFPLSETEEAALKLPTPLPTPVPSMPASPSPDSSPASPLCSPLASPTRCSPLASPASVDSNETYEEKNEWTVKLVTTDNDTSSGDQPRKGIVLKLAKR